MARLFDDASAEYLTYAGAIVTAEPFSFACWFNTDTATINQNLMSVSEFEGDDNADLHGLYLLGAVAGDPVAAYSFDNGLAAYAASTTGFSTGTWQHACGVWSAANSRAAYLNGANKGTNTTSRPVENLIKTSIGAVLRSSMTFARYMSGSIAEVGIWNVALSDAEVAMLAAGYVPLFVRPGNLVAYYPLVRDQDYDIVGGCNMSAVNTPSISTHPRIRYPSSKPIWGKYAPAHPMLSTMDGPSPF